MCFNSELQDQNCTFHTSLSLSLRPSPSGAFAAMTAESIRSSCFVYIPAPLDRSPVSFTIMKLFVVVVAAVALTACTVPSVTAAGELDFACGEFIGVSYNLIA